MKFCRQVTLGLAIATGSAATGSCDSRSIELVDDPDGKADFGRTELIEAMSILAATPDDPVAYRAFAKRVEELRPSFNRDMSREAELRLAFLAVGPMKAQLTASPRAQLEALATTVWPTLLEIPVVEGEDADAYIQRLCRSELALTCHNVIPERWPELLNAQLWRRLKTRLQLSYERCRSCSDDPTFAPLLGLSRDAQIRMELLAKDAALLGRPQSWPRAGAHAEVASASPVVTFGADGLVSVDGQSAPGGDWRHVIVTHPKDSPLGIHLQPERLVKDLLEIVEDARQAGYRQVALMVREAHFPYDLKQYIISSAARRPRELNVKDSDSIQILVQSLDLRNSKQNGS